MNQLWKHFECQQCRKCCREIGLPYDPNSILEMADFLNYSIEQVIEKYYGKVSGDGFHWESEDGKRTPCSFLKHANAKYFCEIYLVRPIECKLYPIERDAGHDGVDCPAWEIAISKLRKEQEEISRF